ncbi:alpha/beta fold hydrolase [Actinomadura opuntiae]|uniref:alpha/beta fold hydrolase n=1 Tax=Actinomadura sp. OS1-43 TaxID=604315 RepID=UPI00255AA73F|nr:alpha/beta hydrolase [Actinomadura sp. OS1-43]MDL4812713.1 alpha/beta hydrolase [Actinomadura sp. OS1-43]
MATFVLVPGFWLGAWAWEEVAAGLRDAGHEARPVTLTGLAERAAELTPEVGLDAHIDDVVRAVEDGGAGEVVLVAHSGANMAVTGAADRIPGRVSRVVYVDSGPMPPGMAGIDFHAPDDRAELEKSVAGAGEGWKIPVPPFDPDAHPVNLAGLDAGRLAEMRRRGTPHPFAAASQPLARPEPLPSTPRTLVLCTIPLAAVRQMAGSGNPVFAMMSGPEWTYRELPTGHWPMFSRPRELAALLAESAGGE